MNGSCFSVDGTNTQVEYYAGLSDEEVCALLDFHIHALAAGIDGFTAGVRDLEDSIAQLVKRIGRIR